jgi:hypothetical protein
MFKRISILLFTVYCLLITPAPIFAQTPKVWTDRCVGTGIASDVATIQGIECLFYNILQVIVFFAGLAFFIMFIVGGFKYLTSGGDDKAIGQASSTLTNAILGLVGIIASWLILSLIQKITGINVTNLIIPG